MVKFCRNFCSCAVDLEMVVFNWKRVVSGPSALLGPEMVKFCRNFCSCAVDLGNGRFSWETGRFWPLCPLRGRNGSNLARNDEILPEFLLLCRRPKMAVFKRKRSISGPSALLRLEMMKFCRNFCSCAVDQEMAVFKRKRACFWPICLFGPEMMKFCRNFCSCAVDQEMAVFKRKRAVSGQSALLGSEMVKFCRNFCSCAVDQEMAVF